jgi:hypothetical protein
MSDLAITHAHVVLAARRRARTGPSSAEAPEDREPRTAGADKTRRGPGTGGTGGEGGGESTTTSSRGAGEGSLGGGSVVATGTRRRRRDQREKL